MNNNKWINNTCQQHWKSGEMHQVDHFLLCIQKIIINCSLCVPVEAWDFFKKTRKAAKTLSIPLLGRRPVHNTCSRKTNIFGLDQIKQQRTSCDIYPNNQNALQQTGTIYNKLPLMGDGLWGGWFWLSILKENTAWGTWASSARCWCH